MSWVCFLILITTTALATSWGDLNLHQSYVLQQNFQLFQLGMPQLQISFKKGDRFQLEQTSSIDVPGYPIDLFTFNHPRCPGKDVKSDLEVIAVKNSNPVVEVGVELQDCQLLIYVEKKDVYTNSLFE